ncbi:hypothetical protein A8W25_01485 [Streptomyces sp. ERV7]|nr:hypothetical protein A8W25_01485 [Streptomyces sp. ERV7]
MAVPFAAAALVLASAVVVPRVTASGAEPSCSVAYTVTNEWGGGFQGSVTLINNASALAGWSLGFAFTGNQKVTQGWNAKWSQSAGTVTAANESWNGSLAHGASVTLGFLASLTGANTPPRAFTLNGEPCATTGGGDPTPTPTPTAEALAGAYGGPAPVVTGEYRLGDVRHITADSARLREQLGWRPVVGFAEGMAEFARAELRPAVG